MSAFSEPSNFKSLEDSRVDRRAIREPQCILDLPAPDAGRVSLSPEQYAVAQEELVKKDFVKLDFPKTMKLHVDPPLNGQNFGLVSFIPSKKATPDSDGCYGILKLRGTYHDEKSADAWSENIIRNHDSYAAIDTVWVGKPFPLMRDNSVYRATTREVDIRRKIDEVAREELKVKREQERAEMSSVQERHRNLMRDVAEEKDTAPDDLELYTQLVTKRAHLKYNSEEITRKLQESADLVAKVEAEIAEMDKTHPEYKDEFMERYTSALAAAGISVSSNPLIKYMGSGKSV